MKKLTVEIADTPIKREFGLMDRRTLAQNNGMLFKFPHKSNLSFWMRNTYLPLDIAFIDDDGKILQISEMYPLSTRAIRSNYACKYALEVNKGWFKSNNIKEGSYVVGDIMGKSKRTILAQGFIERIKNFLKNPFQKNKKPDAQPQQQQQPPTQEETPEELTPPEQGVEGQGYPDGVYVEEEQKGQLGQQGQPQGTPQVQENRDLRGQIKLANDYNLQMEILYWTLRGHILPPRKVMPIPNEGYPIKSGKSGEYLVAFDMSPSIQGGDGWTIKGNQPKSFILDNIIKLSLLDANGQEMTPDMIAKMIQGKGNIS